MFTQCPVNRVVQEEAVPNVVNVLHNVSLDCDVEYKSKCTATVAMVSKDRLRVRVAYRVALVMGQEVHSVAIKLPLSRQDAPHPVLQHPHGIEPSEWWQHYQ